MRTISLRSALHSAQRGRHSGAKSDSLGASSDDENEEENQRISQSLKNKNDLKSRQFKKVSERSERALRKTRIRATTKLKFISLNYISFCSLASPLLH